MTDSLYPLNRCIATEDFMLCKAEDRDPAHCLKEGRKVTRCAQDLYVHESTVSVLCERTQEWWL